MIKLKNLLTELSDSRLKRMLGGIGKFRKVTWKGKEYHATLSAGDPGEYFIDMIGVEDSKQKASLAADDVRNFAVDWGRRTIDLV